MVELGSDPAAAPTSGPTQVFMMPGSTASIAVYFEDTVGVATLERTQIIHPWAASGGVSGTVDYVDEDPGQPGGGSVFVDVANADWILAGSSVSLNHNETSGQFFGIMYGLQDVDPGPGGNVPNPGGANYIMQFDLQASPEASGLFTLAFGAPGLCSGNVCVSGTYEGAACSTNAACSDTPGSVYFPNFGVPLASDFQPLEIVIGACETRDDCAIASGNDPCVWYDCVDGACLEVPRTTQADYGSANGGCSVDGACDGNDQFHALNCFSDKDTSGEPSDYPCEENPTTAYNVDASGSTTSCVQDTTCDNIDAIHALTLCFQRMHPDLHSIPYQCDCRPGACCDGNGNCLDGLTGFACESLGGTYQGAATSCPDSQQCGACCNAEGECVDAMINLDVVPPEVVCGPGNTYLGDGTSCATDVCSGPRPDAPLPETAMTLRAPRTARPGDVVDVDVYTDNALEALLGYQLHIDAAGGEAGTLELVDIFVDVSCRDWAFGDVQESWRAFNAGIGQMLAGVTVPEGVPTPADRYLATFSFRVSGKASGVFTVGLHHSPHGADVAQRTFLFGQWGRMIEVSAIRPARIEIAHRRRLSRGPSVD